MSRYYFNLFLPYRLYNNSRYFLIFWNWKLKNWPNLVGFIGNYFEFLYGDCQNVILVKLTKIFFPSIKYLLCGMWCYKFHQTFPWNLTSYIMYVYHLREMSRTRSMDGNTSFVECLKKFFWKSWDIIDLNLIHKRKLFEKFYEVCVSEHRYFSTHFLKMLCINKMFLRVHGNIWCNF